MRYYTILLGLILTIACGSDKNSNKKDSPGQESTDIKSNEVDTAVFVNINNVLYNEFVSVNAGPFVDLNDSGYFYLDVEYYIDGLESLQIFSKEFYKHEEIRVESCKKDLVKLKFSGDIELGWEPESCSFFNYMYWLKSQEKPLGGYEIKELLIKDDYASSQLVFYDNFNEKKSYWGKGLKIKYKKENSAWKITQIVD